MPTLQVLGKNFKPVLRLTSLISVQLQQQMRPRPFTGCSCNSEVVSCVRKQVVKDKRGRRCMRYVGAPRAKQSEDVLCYLPVGLERALPDYFDGG